MRPGIWSRIRRRYCAKWESEHQLPEIWGQCSDATCDRAAYLHNLSLGPARPCGFDGASV